MTVAWKPPRCETPKSHVGHASFAHGVLSVTPLGSLAIEKPTAQLEKRGLRNFDPIPQGPTNRHRTSFQVPRKNQRGSAAFQGAWASLPHRSNLVGGTPTLLEHPSAEFTPTFLRMTECFPTRHVAPLSWRPRPQPTRPHNPPSKLVPSSATKSTRLRRQSEADDRGRSSPPALPRACSHGTPLPCGQSAPQTNPPVGSAPALGFTGTRARGLS